MAHKSSTTSFLLLTCFAAAAALLLTTASSAHAFKCRPESECCPGSKPCPSGFECAICDRSAIPNCICTPTESMSQLRKLEQQQPQQELSLVPASSPALRLLSSSSSSNKLGRTDCFPDSQCCPGSKECADENMECLICTLTWPKVLCFCVQPPSLPAEEDAKQQQQQQPQQKLSLVTASSPALRLLSSSSSSNKLGGMKCFPYSPCCPGKWKCADKNQLCSSCTKSIPAYCRCSSPPVAEEELVLLPPGTLTGKEGGVTEEEDAKVPLLKLVTG